jgi:flagellin-like protein
MKKLLKSKKALSPVVAAIILIAVTVAVSIAVAAWMGSLTIGFMDTKEAKITAMEFTDDGGTPADQFIVLTVTNPGTTKVNVATIKLNDETIDETDVYEGADLSTQIDDLPIEVAAGASSTQYTIDHDWTSGNKYSVSFFETDGTLIGSYTATA